MNFPFIAFRNSIPPGPPTPDPTIPPPPPQPELPPDEPPYPDAPTPTPGLPPFPPQDPPNQNHNPRELLDSGYFVTHKRTSVLVLPLSSLRAHRLACRSIDR
jgi:hypothetical protein